MGCNIVKLSSSEGAEFEVRVYSEKVVREYLNLFVNDEFAHYTMHNILLIARNNQLEYVNQNIEKITDIQIEQTSKNIYDFIKDAPDNQTYRIKEIVPCPKDEKQVIA